MPPNHSNPQDEDSGIMDWGLMIFGLVVSILFLIMLFDGGFKHLFDVTPRGWRLDGIPGFLILGACIAMFYFSLVRIINRKKKKQK